MCDERYSQPDNGWLKKVGVLDFAIGFQEDQCVMRDIASQVTAGSKRWVS